MTGVTILSTNDIYNISGLQILISFIPYLLAAVLGFVTVNKAFKKNSSGESVKFPVKFYIIIIIGATLTMASIIFLDSKYPAKYVETQYEISINDTASFNEVYDNFIIIEEKENTFIVKEK